MRTIAMLILATVALATWATTAFLVERRQESLQGAVVSNADYQRCVTIVPGPIQPRRVVLHPGNSELS